MRNSEYDISGLPGRQSAAARENDLDVITE